MPEPLKDLYTAELVNAVASEVKSAWPAFDSKGFVDSVFDESWPGEELKQRMAHLTGSLFKFLPLSYAHAVDVLVAAASRFEGFEYMFFPGFVERYGLDDFDTSVSALGSFTRYASAEFAVRPLIKRYPEAMMKQMQQWAESTDEHQRRLASEGCRPRLPWAMALPAFQQDPSPVLPILEALKNDNSEYVRRSVANNLNDIAKDHPDLVVNIAKSWLGNNKHTDRLVRHACRTLLKQGHPQVMPLFGYAEPANIAVSALKLTESVQADGTLSFSFDLSSSDGELGQIRIDYVIGFLRKNGKLSDKVFKLSESTVSNSSKKFAKAFSFKPITTRVYYPGKHKLRIKVNGVELACSEFELLESN